MKVHVHNIQLLLLSPLECQLQVLTHRICSNNLGKPERAQHKQYIEFSMIIMVRQSREMYASMALWT